MGTLPLLRRTSLLPGESLPSLLVRLAGRNFYEPSRLLDRACLAGVRVRGMDKAGCPLQAETYERIAALTQIDPNELYTATAHRFAPVLTPPDVTPETLKLPGDETASCLAQGIASKQLRKETAAQFCPDCLRENPYHRLIWLPIAASACLEHKRTLVNLCPKCHKPVTIQSVVQAHCGRCEAHLTEARLIHTGEDELGMLAQQVIQAWLMDKPLPSTPTPYSLPDFCSTCLHTVHVRQLAKSHSQPVSLYMYKQHPEAFMEKRGGTIITRLASTRFRYAVHTQPT